MKRDIKMGMKQSHGRSLGLCVCLGVVTLAGLFLAGCKGVPTKEERTTRHDFQTVAETFRPQGESPALPTLTTNSPFADFLTYAMLNQPRIEAAYFDWAASVEDITVARSRPDPVLTFQMDIKDVVMSVMPGLMQAFPGPGKLHVRGNVAAAGSQVRYFAFENAVLQTAFAVKRAYYQLWFLDDKIRINRQTLALLADLDKIARTQNEVGKATLQDVYRAQIEEDRLTTEIANLEDSRNSLLAQFKGALGVTANQPNPPVPNQFESTPLDLSGDALLATAFERNPRLKAMRADVQMAEAQIALARKAKVPDFNLGLMADAWASPTMFRPQAGMTLPIWRDKIAAEISAAQANKRSAQARLTSEQINLTVDFAMKTYEYREVTRNLALLRNQLIPKARQSLNIAQASYLAGEISFFNLMDAERSWLNFQLQEVETRTRREIVLAELSLTIAGIIPEGAPVLSSATNASNPSANPSLP
jgi:outer membrane protein, heavy metal efflux system